MEILNSGKKNWSMLIEKWKKIFALEIEGKNDGGRKIVERRKLGNKIGK